MIRKSSTKKYLMFTLAFFAIFLLSSSFVYAQTKTSGFVNCGVLDLKDDYQFCNFCNFLELLQSITNFIMWYFAPVSAALLIGIGGFFILFSGESPDKRRRGFDIMKTAIIGFIIIFISWVLINEILLFLSQQPGSGTANIFSKPWNKISCN